MQWRTRPVDLLPLSSSERLFKCCHQALQVLFAHRLPHCHATQHHHSSFFPPPPTSPHPPGGRMSGRIMKLEPSFNQWRMDKRFFLKSPALKLATANGVCVTGRTEPCLFQETPRVLEHLGEQDHQSANAVSENQDSSCAHVIITPPETSNMLLTKGRHTALQSGDFSPGSHHPSLFAIHGSH